MSTFGEIKSCSLLERNFQQFLFKDFHLSNSRSNASTCLSEDDALQSQWREVSVVTRSLFGFICPKHGLG